MGSRPDVRCPVPLALVAIGVTELKSGPKSEGRKLTRLCKRSVAIPVPGTPEGARHPAQRANGQSFCATTTGATAYRKGEWNSCNKATMRLIDAVRLDRTSASCLGVGERSKQKRLPYLEHACLSSTWLIIASLLKSQNAGPWVVVALD